MPKYRVQREGPQLADQTRRGASFIGKNAAYGDWNSAGTKRKRCHLAEEGVARGESRGARLSIG